MLKVPTYFLGPSKRKFRNERYSNGNTQRRCMPVSKTTLNTTIEYPRMYWDQIDEYCGHANLSFERVHRRGVIKGALE